MRLYWLRGRAEQGQLKIFWEPGGESWAGYFTKSHPPTHHAKVSPIYLKDESSPSNLQGCAGLAKGHQPAGKRAGSQGHAQRLSQVAKDAATRILARAAAAQA